MRRLTAPLALAIALLGLAASAADAQVNARWCEQKGEQARSG